MAETVAQTIARRQREREALEAEEERARQGAPTFIQQRGKGLTGALREGVLQADTAARTAANTLTFGGADSLAAGLDALIPDDRGIRERYNASLAAEQARNDYDALHRPLARQVGMGAVEIAQQLSGCNACGRLRRAKMGSLQAPESFPIRRALKSECGSVW